MKMYICILDDIKDDYVPLVAAHASLACYLTFKDDERMIRWQCTSFKKVICKICLREFAELKEAGYYNITTESALDGKTVAISFCPRESYPKMFKYIPLWKPTRLEITT